MIDLQFQYSPFVDFEISHEYFEKDAARYLVFGPTAQTQKTLEGLGLLYRRNDNGFVLLVDQSNKDRFSKLLEDETALSFGFWIGNNNPYFSSITEYAPQNFSDVFYFRNDENSKKEPISMYNGDFVSETETVSVLTSDFELDSIDADQILKVLNSNGDTVLEDKRIDVVQKVQSLSEGYFEIHDSSAKQLTRFVSLPFSKPKYLVGFAEMKFNKAQITEIIDEIERGNAVPKTNFDLSFKSKSAYWRYLLIAQYAKSLDKSKLSADQKDIKFSGPKKVEMPNGVEAIEFQSEKPLKMAEYSGMSFQLTTKNGQSGTDKILVKRMPLPSVDSLIMAEDNKSCIAEIIFNL